MFTGQPAFDGEREDRLLVCYCPREIFVKGWMPLGHAIRVHSFIFCQIIFAIIIIILVVSQNQGLIYSFGEEGMQLVQPSKFFSVTIFRTRFHRQYWHARVRTWAMLLFLVTLKNFDVCTVTMGVACPLLRRSI